MKQTDSGQDVDLDDVGLEQGHEQTVPLRIPTDVRGGVHIGDHRLEGSPRWSLEDGVGAQSDEVRSGSLVAAAVPSSMPLAASFLAFLTAGAFGFGAGGGAGAGAGAGVPPGDAAFQDYSGHGGEVWALALESPHCCCSVVPPQGSALAP